MCVCVWMDEKDVKERNRLFNVIKCTKACLNELVKLYTGSNFLINM